MARLPATRRAFTLVELMLSIALGSLIVAVATAGFQAASQSVTLANRLSVQNAVLRAAVVAANQEMDFWDTFDSRSDPSRQPLRSAGCPFAPMSFTAPGTVLELDQSDPRQWWNGQLWSSDDKRFGDYSLFGRQGLTDPAVPAERAWRHNIVPALSATLGYYATLDYLPANFVYGFYAADGRIPAEFGDPGVGANHFRSDWHSGHKPLCKVESGHDNGYIFTNVTGFPGLPSTHPVSHHAIYNNHSPTGVFDSVSYPDGWNAFPVIDFSSRLPASWPKVTMRVKVTYHWMDFRQQVRISQTDPLTGQTTTLVLHGLTTTLRGARRQRGLDTMPPDPRYP